MKSIEARLQFLVTLAILIFSIMPNFAIFTHMRFYFIMIFICCANLLFSQKEDYAMPIPRDYSSKPAKNAGFIELGGNAGLYSLNFDRIYYYKERFKLSARVGYAPHFNGIYIEQECVIENNFILFKNPHHLELGFGSTLQRRYNERPNEIDNYFWENIIFGITRCGYRYQKQDDGLFVRAALTPVFMSKDEEGFHPTYFQLWAGVCVGISF